MKYCIYAKILGTFLPDKPLRINNCKITKGLNSEHHPYDRPQIPVTDASSMYHCLGGGVKNFIYYPQKPLSVRTFESENCIQTEILASDVSQAVEIAIERFEKVVAVLSLSLRNTIRKVGNRRVRRDDEYYDYEIVAGYIKRGKQFQRVKLPEPLVNGHNFFPKVLPKGFIGKAKKFLACHDPAFWKALSYFHKASRLRDTGNFDSLLVTLNSVKTIELLANTLITKKTNGKGEKIGMKERIQLAGKKIGVTAKSIKYAKEAWDIRNNGDIAHSRQGVGWNFSNYFHNQTTSTEFLIKYYKYVTANPPTSYIFGGRNGWRMT